MKAEETGTSRSLGGAGPMAGEKAVRRSHTEGVENDDGDDDASGLEEMKKTS